MSSVEVKDGEDSFEVTLVEASRPSRVVLFAVGGGGDPRRHGPLLDALVGHGCTVVAPHFARLVSPTPSDDDLVRRARRLRIALDTAGLAVPAVGVGHSIGATMLLALAGAQVWTRDGRRLPLATDERLQRLVLLAPATGWFARPGALDAVRTPVLAWAGSEDTITPPAQAELLERVLGTRVSLDLRITEGAGHFSFMNTPPPGTTEPLSDRAAFLAELQAEVCAFATS